MRDHPLVPNVFRVASTHSINSENPYSSAYKSAKNTSNCNTQQQHQQQQQQQHQQQQQQHQQQQQQHQQQQQQQQHQQQHQQNQQHQQQHQQHQQQQHQHQQHHHGSNAIEQQPLLPPPPPPIAVHQLTTSASIEHSHPSQQLQLQHQHQQQQQHSPYATLPRGQRFAPEQQQQTGVINTISGSIPATGFGTMSGSFSELHLNNISNMGNHNSNSNSNNTRSNSSHRRQQQQQRQVAALGHYKTAKEVQQQQHQKQQQHLQQHQRQQQQHRLGTGVAGGVTDPQGRITSMGNVSGSYLWLLTPVAASISVAIVIAALAGPQWLFTEEKLPNYKYNGTANINAVDDGAYVTKYTKSSLWILCSTQPGLDVDSYNCIKIDYFPKEGYQPDPHDSTAAIPYTVTKSCPIFLAAGVFLMISFIVFLIPTCSHRNNLYYFSAGILFIVSGLVMLIGLIAYISILKAEIGSKLRPRSPLQPALVKVTYGQSFFLFVFGFIVTEFVGVLNIFLFINLQEVSYYSRLPCFSVANMQAKFKEDQQQPPMSHSYKRYKQPGNAGSQEGLSVPNRNGRDLLQPQRNHDQDQATVPQSGILRSTTLNPRQHQVHDARRGQQTGGYPGQAQTLPGACRKHPNAGSNLNLNNDLARRFYFEKPAVSKCNLHSRSFAKSLNELCTETSVPMAAASSPVPLPDPLPAPALFADLPQEFPLTRSVSTATDIYTAPTAPAAASSSSSSSAQMKGKQQRNMATNTRSRSGLGSGSGSGSGQGSGLDDAQSRLCGLKRGLRKTKDELFQEFCRRAGMRSKPKNIYYISGGDEGEEGGAQEVVKRDDPLASPALNSNPNADNDEDDDDDADGDDHGFRQFRLEEDHLYVVGDHAQLVVPRRSSMCVDSMGQNLRRLNSNLSLHTDPSYPGVGYPNMRMSLPPAASDLGQSRTLPRCFLRQSSDSLQSGFFGLGSSQQRFSQLMLNSQQLQKQQPQQQNCYLSTLALPQVSQVSQAPPPPPKSQVQWPVAIPSSPSNYSNGYQQHPQPIYPTSNGGVMAPGTTSGVAGQPAKFQRGYAFDDAQRRSSFVSEAFDLDEIERERRRSHASLFGINQIDPYDLINGTAV